jgi:16S rRNA G1207 methylase RsmC
LFSHRAVDRGTWILLRHGPAAPARGDLLDLGCGYGPIAVTLARRCPAATVWAVDSDERALELTARNARLHRLSNVVVAAPREVPDRLRFAGIYSNPPIKIGKLALRALLGRWLATLAPGAAAHLVVKQSMGADSLAAALVSLGHPVERAKAKDGFRVLTVRPVSGKGG